MTPGDPWEDDPKVMTDRGKAYRKRKKKEGKCPRCGSPAVEGKTMCQVHLDYLKNYCENLRVQTRNKWVDEFVDNYGPPKVIDVYIRRFGYALLKAWGKKFHGSKQV